MSVNNMLSVDPSIKALGYAMFTRGKLKSSGHKNLKSKKDWVSNVDEMVEFIRELLDDIDLCVIELPDVFTSARGLAASNSGAIVKLMAIVFAVRQMCLEEGIGVYLLPVRKWKGNLPKEITQLRMKRRWGVVSKSNDEIDAIGIGTFYLERIKP